MNDIEKEKQDNKKNDILIRLRRKIANCNIKSSETIKFPEIKRIEESKTHTIIYYIFCILIVLIFLLILYFYEKSTILDQYQNNENLHYTLDNQIFTATDQIERLNKFIDGMPTFLLTLVFSGTAFYFSYSNYIKSTVLENRNIKRFDYDTKSFSTEAIPILVILLLGFSFLLKIASYFRNYSLKFLLGILSIVFSFLFISLLSMQIIFQNKTAKKINLRMSEIFYIECDIERLKKRKKKTEESILSTPKSIKNPTLKQLQKARTETLKYSDFENKKVLKSIKKASIQEEKEELAKKEIERINELTKKLSEYKDILISLPNEQID